MTRPTRVTARDPFPSMPAFRPLTLLLVALFFPGLPLVRAGDQIARYAYPERGDSFVLIETVFGGAAKQGALPFRITIRNHTGADRVWTIHASEGDQYGRQLGMSTSLEIPVPEGTEATRELILPYAPNFLSNYYRGLQFEVSAPGLPEQTFHHSEAAPDSFPTLAISPALASHGLNRLDREVSDKNSSNPYFAKEFIAADLPTDWIAYSGLDGLLMDASLWRAITTAQRQAMVAWVRLGGRLDLYGAGAFDATLPDLPGGLIAGAVTAMGGGQVGLFDWDGKGLPAGLVTRYESLGSAADPLDRDFDRSWRLYDLLDPGNFQPLFIFILLLAFAILVAPINLFFFARAGRRHRLFITTPLISLATCGVLFLMIFFIDGLGGSGHRVVLAEVQGGGENRTYILQEQLSRTGVMLSSGFTTEQAMLVHPVRLPDSRLNPFANSGTRSARFGVAGDRFSGPWFRSRSEQGYQVRAAIPSRARIESRGVEEGVPVLVSNLPETITHFAYEDAMGQQWLLAEGARVGSGDRIPLVKQESTRRVEWREEILRDLSETRRLRIRERPGKIDRFFAQVERPDAFVLPTHPSIRWKSTRLLLTGSPAAAPAAAPPAETPKPE